MIFRSSQFRKEARPLLMPWAVVMFVGGFSLLHMPRDNYYWRSLDLLNWILPLGCFFAIPLLASLPLGSEFQHRTLTFLLAQPVDRETLWRQKVTIMLAAVMPATALYLLSARINPEFEGGFWLAAVWIISSVSGSVAGTLIARSSIGGLALSSAFQGILFLIWNRLAEPQRHNGHFSSAFLWITAVALVFYATCMVLLGRRMFLQFQAIEGGHANLDSIPGLGFLQQIGTSWLRCRPRGAVLNLIRREFHLLRTVWLLGFFSLFMWICLILLGIVRPNNNDGRAPLAAGIAATLSFAIALLSGALSIGEEKNWGTHAWQLTLPLSLSVQWLVKLLAALFTTVICAAAIPISVLLVGGWFHGSPLLYLGDTDLWFYPLAAAAVTLMAFWSCCAVKGTVHAVVGFFALLFSLAFAISFGPWLADQAMLFSKGFFNLLVGKLDPVSVHHVLSVLIGAGFITGIMGKTIFSITIILLVAFGLMQSRRMFRAAAAQSSKYIVRRALPLLAICLLPSLAVAIFFEFAMASWRQQEVMWTETHHAIEAAQRDKTGEKAVQPQRLTMEALAKASPLSDSTRKWLNNSHIIVIPEPIQTGSHAQRIQWPYENALIIRPQRGANAVPYSAAIRTAAGHECNLRFWAEPSKEWAGFLYHLCQ